jgi:hypothetical protein
MDRIPEPLDLGNVLVPLFASYPNIQVQEAKFTTCSSVEAKHVLEELSSIQMAEPVRTSE